ncbi:FAD-dependent oxidoreductase [Streptomyces sp. NPDC001985]|uniref:NAD(P)/FAD-dependent oxidoreductase n=1 Tax=Streptomyces sp. NPDC001985 TaxID=3154406 RepID=UPI00332833D9
MSGDVIVVGGGVSGLVTAVVLAERGRRVRVRTREEPAGTTSSVAGGLWWPYRIEPREQVARWSVATLRVYEEFARRPDETGVRLVAGVMAEQPLAGLGPWAAGAGVRAARPGELPGGHTEGVRARVPLVDMPAHLGWLRRRLEAAGGSVEVRPVRSLAEAAASAGAVVNCAGLGARRLASDAGLRPVRGQLVLVENPGVTEWFVLADGASERTTYLLPQPGRLILGGTAEEGAWGLEPVPATAEAIVARCARLWPEVASARVLGHRVGLRPARPAGVRIERENLPDGGVVIHNYGHGGAGVTVAWGCARAAADLVPEG